MMGEFQTFNLCYSCKVPGVSKKYTKFIKRNVKLITSINDILIIFDCKESNLTFEPSFVEIHQLLRNKWIFEH